VLKFAYLYVLQVALMKLSPYLPFDVTRNRLHTLHHFSTVHVIEDV